MTTITWDRKTLAADRRMINGNLIMSQYKIQICTCNDGDWVLTACGDTDKALDLIQWFREGHKDEIYPNYQAGEDFATLVAVNFKGQAFEYNHLSVGVPIIDKYMAWGSGGHFALGAMAMGADARKAVEIAAMFDCYSGGDIDSVEITSAGVKYVGCVGTTYFKQKDMELVAAK